MAGNLFTSLSTLEADDFEYFGNILATTQTNIRNAALATVLASAPATVDVALQGVNSVISSAIGKASPGTEVVAQQFANILAGPAVTNAFNWLGGQIFGSAAKTQLQNSEDAAAQAAQDSTT